MTHLYAIFDPDPATADAFFLVAFILALIAVVLAALERAFVLALGFAAVACLALGYMFVV